MDKVKGWVRLVFALGGAWIPLNALLMQSVDPTHLIGPAITGFLVYAVGSVVVDAIPADPPAPPAKDKDHPVG